MKVRNLLFIIILACSSSLFALANSAKEADLKAAYIYNFARYTNWAGIGIRGNEFIICVYKGSDLLKSIKKLEMKRVKGKKIKVIVVGDGKHCLRPCHVVILPKLQGRQLESLVEKAVAGHVLSISDTDGYAQKGVAINLKKVSNKMTFEINIDQVRQSRLKLSSNLLKMATIVRNN